MHITYYTSMLTSLLYDMLIMHGTVSCDFGKGIY